MRLTLALSALLALGGCGSDTSTEPVLIETPAHNYSEEKDGIYYYVGAVSDNDRANGKASGDVVSFRYLGFDKNGDYKVSLLDDEGKSASTATCPRKCRIIKFDNGDKAEYNTASLIGAVFEDAINNHLTQNKP